MSDDKHMIYSLQRRNRRLGYAIDNILTGCKLLLVDLDLDQFAPEDKAKIEVIKERTNELLDKSKTIEEYLLSIANIYEKLTPQMEIVTEETTEEVKGTSE